MPLNHPDVQHWREQRFGPNAPLAPTLLTIAPGNGNVRAWTGTAMAVRLTRHLGPRSSLRVLDALGRAEREFERRPGRSDDGSMRRAQFLRLGVGAAAAVGLVAAGRVPAFAAGESDAASKWAKANAGQLPTSYDELVRYSVAYRKAIFRASAPAVRSKLWVDHINGYRPAHSPLSDGQRQVLRRAAAVAATASIFELGGSNREVHEQLNSLRSSVASEFSPDETFSILAMLGPDMRPASPQVPSIICTCATNSPYCGSANCNNNGCTVEGGCGSFWAYACDGNCY
jgi:hypothetical protein